MTQLPSPVGPNPSLPQPMGLGYARLTLASGGPNNIVNQARWLFRASGNPETGGNAGSELSMNAINDDGSPGAEVVFVERGIIGAVNSRYFLARKLVPAQDTGAFQAGNFYGIYAGTGVPNNANGVNGDYYFRGDTPGIANQRIYIKSAGAWVGIV